MYIIHQALCAFYEFVVCYLITRSVSMSICQFQTNNTQDYHCEANDLWSVQALSKKHNACNGNNSCSGSSPDLFDIMLIMRAQ